MAGRGARTLFAADIDGFGSGLPHAWHVLKCDWRSDRRWAPSFGSPRAARCWWSDLTAATARVKLPKLGWVKFRISRLLRAMAIRSATLTRRGSSIGIVSLLIDDGTEPGGARCAGHSGWSGSWCRCSDRRQRRSAYRPDSSYTEESGDAYWLCSGDSRGGGRDCQPREDPRFWVRYEPRSGAAGRTSAPGADRLAPRTLLVVIEDSQDEEDDPIGERNCSKQPGKLTTYAAKSGLNRAIWMKGWHQFALALASAARYTGTAVVTVPAASRRNAARCVGMWIRNPVRAKRYSGAPTAHVSRARGCQRCEQHSGRRACGHACERHAPTAGRIAVEEAGTSRKPRRITAPTQHGSVTTLESPGHHGEDASLTPSTDWSGCAPNSTATSRWSSTPDVADHATPSSTTPPAPWPPRSSRRGRQGHPGRSDHAELRAVGADRGGADAHRRRAGAAEHAAAAAGAGGATARRLRADS